MRYSIVLLVRQFIATLIVTFGILILSILIVTYVLPEYPFHFPIVLSLPVVISGALAMALQVAACASGARALGMWIRRSTLRLGTILGGMVSALASASAVMIAVWTSAPFLAIGLAIIAIAINVGATLYVSWQHRRNNAASDKPPTAGA